MTRLRPRRKQPKEEATRRSTSREANILEGMVLKKKSDHSLAPNKKLRIQWNHAAWTILAVNYGVGKDKTSCLTIICFSLPILFLRDQGKDYPVKVTGDAQILKCSKSQACEGMRIQSRLNRSVLVIKVNAWWIMSCMASIVVVVLVTSFCSLKMCELFLCAMW